jgi:hypothetical protein
MLPTGSWVGLDPREILGLDMILGVHGIKFPKTMGPDWIQHNMFDVLGAGKKVYGDSMSGIDEALIYANSGYLDAMQSLLWRIPLRSIYGEGGPKGPVFGLLTAGTVNWELRRVLEHLLQKLGRELFIEFVKIQGVNWTDPSMPKLFVELLEQSGEEVHGGLEIIEAFALGGPRLTVDKAGNPNPYIKWYKGLVGVLPSEIAMLARIFLELTGAPFGDDHIVTGSDNLDDLVKKFALGHKELAESQIYVPLNAGAADKALQIRAVLREVWGKEFDADADNPQLYFSVEGFRIARNATDGANPAEWQRPWTFMSYIARIVKQTYLLGQTS